MLERELVLLLEPSCDRCEKDALEADSGARYGSVGRMKGGLRGWLVVVVVEMEVEVSSLSLRSDTFLPDASSPYIVAGRGLSLSLSVTGRSVPLSVGLSSACKSTRKFELQRSSVVNLSQRPCHPPPTATACCSWWSVPVAGQLDGVIRELTLSRTTRQQRRAHLASKREGEEHEEEKGRRERERRITIRLICTKWLIPPTHTHTPHTYTRKPPANPAPFELGGPATRWRERERARRKGRREGQVREGGARRKRVRLWAAFHTGERRDRVPSCD